jgi:hypothetical protein
MAYHLIAALLPRLALERRLHPEREIMRGGDEAAAGPLELRVDREAAIVHHRLGETPRGEAACRSCRRRIVALRQAGQIVVVRWRRPLQSELQREMPGDSYVTVTPFANIVGRQKRSRQLGATMFTGFGALALVIAAVGLYSVIAYDVTQRALELSVRVALGARARDVTRVVVAQGFRFATVGIGIGMGVALLGARWLQPLLFQ